MQRAARECGVFPEPIMMEMFTFTAMITEPRPQAPVTPHWSADAPLWGLNKLHSKNKCVAFGGVSQRL